MATANNLSPRDRRQARNKKKAKKARNKETVAITYSFLAVFIALCAYFAYFVQVEGVDFSNNSYNSRLSSLSEYIIRGDILASDGTVLATTTTDSSGNETRVYTYGRVFAHAVGYAVNGMSGIELDANYNLLKSHSFFLTQLVNDINEEKNQGDSVVTTLDVSLQQACYNALGDYDGAVICIEPSTGKILAMVSKPDYDPNTIAEDWASIVDESSGSSVLLNRATQGLYTPGSTFKIFTLSAYLEQYDADDFSYLCEGSYDYGDYSLHCYNGKSHGSQTLRDAFANSCNGAFASIGLMLDADDLAATAENMLFNTSLPTRLKNTATSSLSLSSDTAATTMMQIAIGQSTTLVSPLHMAMIASAICNGGKLMTPYIIDHTENDAGQTTKRYYSKSAGRLYSASEAAELEEYLRAVVTDGTATVLDTTAYTAYGKTGTAEVSSSADLENSWFVGYARDDDGKEIAIAIVYESISAGSTKASTATKAIFDTYFSN